MQLMKRADSCTVVIRSAKIQAKLMAIIGRLLYRYSNHIEERSSHVDEGILKVHLAYDDTVCRR